MELKAPPDQRANGIPYNFLLHQGKPNNLRGFWDITHWTSNAPTSDQDWLRREQERWSHALQLPRERYCSPKCTTPYGNGTRKEKLLSFFEIKVQLRKAPGFSSNPKMQKGSDQAANLRSQIWYPRTSKNTTREGWAGLPKRYPSESRSLTTTCPVILNAN